MKRKILFIVAILFSFGNTLFSQCISVELSITWQNGYHIFKKDSAISIPILNITYRNSCDSDYYFLKVSPRSNEKNLLLCWPPYYDDNNYYRIAKSNIGKYTNLKFNVTIGNLPFYNASWMVFSDTIEYSEQSFSFEYIGCALQEVYNYIHQDFKQEEYADFAKGGIIVDDILGYAKNQFVFLKSGELFTDYYNLIAFKLVEGCFTFVINRDTIGNYVVIIEDDIKKLVLPSIVGEYQLYSGGFNTNKVTVCFGER